jgi:hypothetical protein
MRYWLNEDWVELVWMSLAVSGLVVFALVFILISWSPVPEQLLAAKVSFPATWTPTRTPTRTLTRTATPVASASATPSLTRWPTSSISRTPTPSLSPSLTPVATLTVLPGVSYAYQPVRVEFLPSRKSECAWFGIAGAVWDIAGQDLRNVSVRVWSDGWGGYTAQSGRAPEYGGSGWEVYLDSHPKEGRWYVQVISDQGVGQSPAVVLSSTSDCFRNLMMVYWKRSPNGP